MCVGFWWGKVSGMGERLPGLSPGAAAEVLGVSPQTLRRYAGFYEAVYGPVPRRDRQRLFTEEVLGRLRAAQVLVASGQAGGIKGGLEILKDGPPPTVSLPPARPATDPELLRALAGVREGLTRSEGELAGLREDIGALARGLSDYRGAPAGGGQDVGALTDTLERLIAAMVELSQRQVQGSAELAARLEAIEERLDSMERTGAERVSPVPRWQFWRNRA